MSSSHEDSEKRANTSKAGEYVRHAIEKNNNNNNAAAAAAATTTTTTTTTRDKADRNTQKVKKSS